MNELQENSRFNLINTLDYLGSKDNQIRYKKAVPFVHIPYELICQWDAHFIKDQLWFKRIRTEQQWIILNKFDAEFTKICKEIPNTRFEDIPEVLEKPLWSKIIETSQITLRKIQE